MVADKCYVDMTWPRKHCNASAHCNLLCACMSVVVEGTKRNAMFLEIFFSSANIWRTDEFHCAETNNSAGMDGERMSVCRITRNPRHEVSVSISALKLMGTLMGQWTNPFTHRSNVIYWTVILNIWVVSVIVLDFEFTTAYFTLPDNKSYLPLTCIINSYIL